ncbi:MAG: ABC transporter ATP-binding protein [Planctomycetes bacterium]|nr:ABC transporter ATP-binding protein [Planctomycetota bacterium]
MKILEVSNIRKEYGTLVAVNDVNLTLEKGQVVGLIGPNGAGKTTLLRILATILSPTDGDVRVLGHDLKKDYLEIRKCIGFMPDFFNLYNDLTLQECLEFFAQAYKIDPGIIPEQIDSALKFTDLENKRHDYIQHLSRGMVQRLGVAVLLVHNPDLFLLDEPASGLDPKARIQLRDVLRKLSKEGKTIVISSHILTELSGFCTHIAIMNKGKMVRYGSVDEVQKSISDVKKVNISVLDDRDKAVNLIKEFIKVESIVVNGDTITIEVSAEPEVLANLNAHLVGNGIRVVGFCEEKTNLEDLFMKISSGEDESFDGITQC